VVKRRLRHGDVLHRVDLADAEAGVINNNRPCRFR
jgi:hypothetical protein